MSRSNYRFLYFFLAISILLALLTACSSDEPEAFPTHLYSSYDSEQAYLDAARKNSRSISSESDADCAYYRLKKLPEGAEFDYIQVRQGSYVTTFYSIPYDEEGFGKPTPEDAYILEQSTSIVLEHFFGDPELWFEQHKNILQMTESITYNGTEYFYHLWDDCKYYFGYFQDGFAIFAAIPAFAPVEELLQYLDIEVVLP